MFTSPHLIYQPIHTTTGQMPQTVVPQQQQHNWMQTQTQTILQNQQHFKVYIFETKKEDVVSSLDVKLATNIRRGAQPLSYAEFTKYLTEKCSINLENAVLRYLDDENQWIDFANEEELSYGLQVFAQTRKPSTNFSVFKIAVIIIKPAEKPVVVASTETEQQQQQPECPYMRRRKQLGAIHHGHHGAAGWKRGGCPFRQQQREQQQNERCPFLFRKDETTGDSVLEVDVNVEDLKNGLDVGSFIKKNIANVQMPHYGVTCDGCHKYNFIGKRHKCNDCADFDFCDTCFNSSMRDTHHNGFHSFREVPARGCRIFNNLFDVQEEQQAKEPEEETIVDNELYTEEEPEVVEPTVEFVVAEPTVEVEVIPQQEQPVFEMTHPLNTFQQEEEVVQVIPTPFEQELKLLKDMGFFDDNRSLELLKKYEGNLQRVVVDLLH